MSEIYTVSAKTVDEAIDLASKLYGGRNKEISHEIVSLPKKGFLGFGAKKAVIEARKKRTDDDLVKEVFSDSSSKQKSEKVKTEKKAEKKAEKKEEKKAEKQAEKKQ